MTTHDGHVFLVRGDLLDIACDAVVIPTDDWGTLTGYWIDHLTELEVLTEGATQLQKGALTTKGRRPIHDGEVRSEDGQRLSPATWTVPTGVADPFSSDDLEVDMADLRRVLTTFAEAFAAQHGARRNLGGRSCPLIAVPFLGSGAGGFEQRMRPYAAELLSLLAEVATHAHADIVIVLHGPQAGVHEALLRRERQRLGTFPTLDGLAERWERGPVAHAHMADDPAGDELCEVGSVLEELRDRARNGALVPFIGAGVSATAGSVSWKALLEELRTSAATALEGDLPEKVSDDPYGAAQIYENILGPDAVIRIIGEQLTDTRPALQHHLMVALEPRDAVTTNYDTAYEQAAKGAALDVSVIPSTADAPLRLLKLHGTLGRSEVAADGEAGGDQVTTSPLAPVLTRNQLLDHQQHAAALRGALEMMLLTGHVAFVGYGLRDSHLHGAIHQVRKIRHDAGGATPTLATAIQVEPAPSLSLEWSGTLNVIWPRHQHPPRSDAQGEDQPVFASREVEILLDVLADATKLAEIPVLAFREEHLEEDEQALRSHLRQLEKRYPDSENRPGRIADLLNAYGAPSPEARGS